MALLPLTPEQTFAELESADAVLRGHFILSSGLHSDTYLQCARLLTEPARAKRIGDALALKAQEHAKKEGFDIDMVVAPAMGGVVIGYLVASALGVPSIFCERVNGHFCFRRGFDIPKGANVLVAEDVVTTGLSSLETFEVIRDMGGVPRMETCIVDRSKDGTLFIEKSPLLSLLQLQIQTYSPDGLPPHLTTIPAVKPGSRSLSKN